MNDSCVSDTMEMVELYHPQIGCYWVPYEFFKTTYSGSYEKKPDGIFYPAPAEKFTDEL